MSRSLSFVNRALTLTIIVTTTLTTCFNIKKICTLPTGCIFIIRVILKINREPIPNEFWWIILCNGNAVFFCEVEAENINIVYVNFVLKKG
jgi:hypothetical protein